jgi:hypothetical protein
VVGIDPLISERERAKHVPGKGGKGHVATEEEPMPDQQAKAKTLYDHAEWLDVT